MASKPRLVDRGLLWDCKGYAPKDTTIARAEKKARLKAIKAEKKAASHVRSRDFLRSREWLELRYLALKLAGGRCQCCGATAEDGARIHVDHIKPRSKYPRLALQLNNLQILCGECNIGKSNTDKTDWSSQYSARAIGERLKSI